VKLDRPGAWTAFAAVAAFAWGMAILFQDRMEAGDIYPEYSTLRSDPMGCRAFFSALERYPDLTVKRAFARGDFQRQAPGAAYFFLGLDAVDFRAQGESIQEMDSLARQGHRVILGFAPLAMEKGMGYVLKHAGLLSGDSSSQDLPDSLAKDSSITTALRKLFLDTTSEAKRDSLGRKNDIPPDSGTLAKGPLRGKPAPESKRYLREWGFRLRLDTTFKGEERSRAAAQGNTKDTLPWLSGLYFDSLQGPWIVHYRRGDHPVAIERALGSGSIALVSDSYFASNEAQLDSRPALLASLLLGASDRIFFDERHFGVRQDDAVANLLRRYRLHWMLPSLLLLLALYVWKSRAPRDSDADRESGNPPGADSRAALAGLLQRNLSDRQALETCHALWKESGSRAKSALDSEIDAVLERRKSSGNVSLAETYGEIQAILNRRKRS
jgi:hypothetical protein